MHYALCTTRLLLNKKAPLAAPPLMLRLPPPLLQVYLNANRTEVLFTVNLTKPAAIPEYVWEQRGACVRAWEGSA
jgi:hypothetical protein